MDFTVRKAYACPICGESFIKWGLCLSHLHASEPCRSALGEDTLRNVEQLQEMCRAAASGEAAAKQDATVGTTVSPDNSTPEAPVTEVALSTYEPVDGVEASTFEPQGHTSFEMAGMPANYDNMSGVQTTNFNNMTGVTGPTFDTMNANNMTGVTGPNFDGINGNTMTGVAGPTFDSMNSNTMNAVTGPNFDTMNGVAGPNFDAINGVMPSAFEGMNGVAPNFDASNFDAMNGMMPANFNMNGMMPSSFDAMGGVPSAFDAMGAVAQGFDGMMVPQMNQMNVQMNNQMNAQMNAQLNAQMNAQMNAQLLNAQMNAQMSALQMQALQQQQLAQYSQQEAFGPNPTAPTPTQTETKKDAKPWANYKASSASQSQQHKAPSKAQSQQISNLLKPQPKPVPAPKVTPKAPPKAAPKAGDGLMKELADATPAYTKQKAPPPPPLPQPTADANARGLPALDVRCVARLRRALQCGYLTLMERSTLSEKLEELATYAPSKQLATVKKFLSPSYEDFRWISSKAEWLQRCLNYTRARGENYQYKHKGTKSALVEALEKALADHGLLPFAIDEGCWSTFGLLPPLLQENVTKAVRHGLFLSSTLQPSEHFVHICVNEEVVYNLEAKPVPSDMPAPEQAGMESIDQTLYHQLRQYILFQHRNSEDRCLRLLAESGPILPGTPNSLLYVHMATSDERMKGSAEVLSLLHAASACGLSRLCARFLAEGLPASEATGNELATPLHLAAGRGALESVKVLIRAKADVLKKDINGRTPMYYAVTAAQEDAATPAQESQHQLHLQVCQQLLNGVLRVAREGREWDEEESAELERFAEEKHHWPLLNLLSLNNRLRQLGLRNPAALTDTVIQRISELQYETACLLVSFFEDPPETQDPTECLLKVPDEAMPIELQAILESEFIRDHDRLRRQGNRMHRHFGLSKRCLDVWVSLPYDVAQHALSIFMLEQVSAHHFKVPDDELQAMEAEMADEIQIMNVGEDPNRYVGTIRKWDSERGFGFIVQPQPEEETGEEDHKDIFVHRTNLMGSAPGVHIDLQEGSKVSYFLGMQDGKARALQAAMIDDEFYVHQIHLQKKTSKSKNLSPKEKRQARILEIAEQETHEVSKYFLRQIGSATIQDMVHERRQDFESHFRCWGLLRFNNVKRDDVFWKREIERRVDIFVEQASTPLQKKDFDFRVRRFLTEFCMRRNVIRVSEALAMVSKSISGKKREDIQTWPAYVATLLRKFDPEVNAFITSRESQKNSKADADDTIKDEDAEPEEEDSGSDSEDVGSLSDTLDMYSPPPAQPEQLEEAIPEADEEASGFAFQ